MPALPNEILDQIAKAVPFEDLWLRLRTVCFRWNEIAQERARDLFYKGTEIQVLQHKFPATRHLTPPVFGAVECYTKPGRFQWHTEKEFSVIPDDGFFSLLIYLPFGFPMIMNVHFGEPHVDVVLEGDIGEDSARTGMTFRTVAIKQIQLEWTVFKDNIWGDTSGSLMRYGIETPMLDFVKTVLLIKKDRASSGAGLKVHSVVGGVSSEHESVEGE